MKKTTVIDRWRAALQEAVSDDKKGRIKMLLDGSNLIFFFTFNGDPYGASESGRVTFAKMKDPDDEDNSEAWRKEINFSATNLYKCVDGESNQTVFGDKDLKEIKVAEKKDIEKMLVKHAEKS